MCRSYLFNYIPNINFRKCFTPYPFLWAFSFHSALVPIAVTLVYGPYIKCMAADGNEAVILTVNNGVWRASLSVAVNQALWIIMWTYLLFIYFHQLIPCFHICTRFSLWGDVMCTRGVRCCGCSINVLYEPIMWEKVHKWQRGTN